MEKPKKKRRHSDVTLKRQRRVSVRLSPHDVLMLDELCAKHATTYTAVLRAGLQLMVKASNGDY